MAKNGMSFKVGKLDLIIALMFAHLVQDAVNPRFIRLDQQPMVYVLVVGTVAAGTAVLSALVSFVRREKDR